MRENNENTMVEVTHQNTKNTKSSVADLLAIPAAAVPGRHGSEWVVLNYSVFS